MRSDVRCGDNSGPGGGGGRDQSDQSGVEQICPLTTSPVTTAGARRIVNNYSRNGPDLLATGLTMLGTCQNLFFSSSELEDKRLTKTVNNENLNVYCLRM